MIADFAQGGLGSNRPSFLKYLNLYLHTVSKDPIFGIGGERSSLSKNVKISIEYIFGFILTW